MSRYSVLNDKIDDIEQFRRDVIDALRYAGIDVSTNAHLSELPNKIIKLGGVDPSGLFPANMSSIGYDSVDSYRASYRFMSMKLRNQDYECLDISTMVDKINEELEYSIEKYNAWPSTFTGEVDNRPSHYFDGWNHSFPPKFDTSTCEDFSYMFANTGEASRNRPGGNLCYIPTYNTTACTNPTGMFHAGGGNIHELPEFNFIDCTTFEDFAGGLGLPDVYLYLPYNVGFKPLTSMWCMLGYMGQGHNEFWSPCKGAIIKYPLNVPNIDNVGGMWQPGVPPTLISIDAFSGYNRNLELQYSPDLSYNSVKNLEATIGTGTLQGNQQSITFHSTVYNKLDASDIAAFENKGWKVVKSN